MKRLLYLLFILFLLSNAHIAIAQNETCPVRISLLTCAPGQELYSTFGHTALRIIDSTANTDYVYNYGTFDFEDPDFYMKFVRGKLDYFLSVDKYPDFMYEYQYFQRSVWEQELNLSCHEKQQIITAINVNMQAANRMYKYDFIYDNCTTRVRDLIFKSLKGSSIKNEIVPAGTTARNMIHSYLDKGGEPWSKLGIDILLGAKLDKKVGKQEAMFLPDYLLKGVDSGVISNNIQVVKQKQLVLDAHPQLDVTGKYVPLITFSIVCVLLFAVYLVPNPSAVATTRFLDSFLLYITGLLGILLVFMWFGTDHKMTKDNYNLLWALPTNLVAAFFIWRKPAWLKTYFYIAFAINALLLITWFWLPQEINIALTPFVVLLLYRYKSLATKKELHAV